MIGHVASCAATIFSGFNAVPELAIPGPVSAIGQRPAPVTPQRAAPAKRPEGGVEWKAGFRASVSRLLSLKAGWDGPSSAAISTHSVALAERILEVALSSSANPKMPFVVPSPDGGIQLEWHRTDIELEISISPDGALSALVELTRDELEVEKSGVEALDLFLRWAPRAAAANSHDFHEAGTEGAARRPFSSGVTGSSDYSGAPAFAA